MVPRILNLGTRLVDWSEPRVPCLIWGFHRGVNGIFALLRCYAAYIGIYRLPGATYQVPSSEVKQSKENSLDCLTLEYGTVRLSRNVVANYHCTLRNIPSSRVRQSKKTFKKMGLIGCAETSQLITTVRCVTFHLQGSSSPRRSFYTV